MAVVKLRLGSNHWIGPRNFHPPKRADLKSWYRDARKALGYPLEMPEWQESFRIKASVDVNTILFELTSGVEIYIARKQHIHA